MDELKENIEQMPKNLRNIKLFEVDNSPIVKAISYSKTRTKITNICSGWCNVPCHTRNLECTDELIKNVIKDMVVIRYRGTYYNYDNVSINKKILKSIRKDNEHIHYMETTCSFSYGVYLIVINMFKSSTVKDKICKP